MINELDLEVSLNNANHIGSTPDMYHPDYGWVRVDGKLTEAGVLFFKNQKEYQPVKEFTY